MAYCPRLAGFCFVAQPHGSHGQRHLGIVLGVGIAGFGDHRPAQQHPGFFWLALFAGEDAEFVERLGELGLQLEQGFQQRPICAIAGASVAGPDLLLTKDPAAKVESRESTP